MSAHQNGYTLPELLVTLTIATIAVSMIFLVYLYSVKIWKNYNVRVSTSQETWLLHKAIDKQIRQIVSLKKRDNKSWVLESPAGDTGILSYDGRDISYKSKPLIASGRVTHFGIGVIIHQGASPVYSCTLANLSGGVSSELIWKTVPDRTVPLIIPPPLAAQSSSEGLYWEKSQ